ncbi:glycopeptide antibiotics resistance protein [Streptomyces avidinii]|uniref:VanZ family protein n=1 Tax=Streptomyces TaxID=1883 RepID=UPI000BDCD346|nr:glycopeptide antibiotics resistance protein [Streptomyces avidinii]SNX81220.1 Glycopeptide antibiotics resistance protein [Streptomyces microflavus]
MLQTVFNGRGEFVLIALAAVTIAALVGYFAAKKFLDRPWAYAGLFATLAAELSVTIFFPSPGHVSGQCVLNRNYSEPFATEQGLLNVAMFLPIGLFGVLALRRVFPVFLGGALLSVATELGQALAPWVGRSCDSGDVLTNTLGAGIGALIGWAIVRAVRGEVHSLRSAGKPTIVVFAVGFIVCAVVWKAWITPLAVDSTSLQIAGGDEKAQAQQVLAAAFDDHVDIKNVQLQSGQNDAPDLLMITLESGFAELSWPDKEQLTVSLESTSEPGPGSFAVPGAGAAPESADDALRIATKYAKERFPWGLEDSHVKSFPVGDDAEFGWMVSWRSRVDGVLMPMRLDVQINRAGRVSALLTRHPEDFTSIPPRKVSEKQAAATASKYAGGAKTAAGNLLAIRREGEWRAQWVIPVSSGTDSYPVYVDAETGKVDERASPVQGLPTAPN